MLVREKRRANTTLKLLIVVLAGVLLIIGTGAYVSFSWDKGLHIIPKRVPTGDPIQITVRAHLQPAGWITQRSETIKIEFTHATFPDNKVGSVTLRLNKQEPQKEVSLTLPCSAGYDYTIESTSDLLVDGVSMQATGNAKGTVHCVTGKVLSYEADPHATVEFLKRPPAQRIGTPTYRPYFDLADDKK